MTGHIFHGFILMVSLRKKVVPKFCYAGSEYTIDSEQEQKTYRLITSLLDPKLYPALLLAREYHQRSRSRKYN